MGPRYAADTEELGHRNLSEEELFPLAVYDTSRPFPREFDRLG